MKDKDYQSITESLNCIRRLTINEAENNGENENSGDAVPYTMQDELMSSIVDTAKKQFGASFEQSKNAMLYYPTDGDVTLSGTIGTMNDAKFQFRYKDASGNGCYIWTNPLQLTDDTLKTITVIYGVYKNWKQELASAEDVKPMSMRGMDEQMPQPQQPQITPGDDLD